MGDAATRGLRGGHSAASGRSRHRGVAGHHGGNSFFRFQLGLALTARPETRAEGIRWLRNGFDLQPLYRPLTRLALGRTYEAAGQRDSAAISYSRFLRLWDKADPELQGRVREAREALQEITREQPASR